MTRAGRPVGGPAEWSCRALYPPESPEERKPGNFTGTVPRPLGGCQQARTSARQKCWRAGGKIPVPNCAGGSAFGRMTEPMPVASRRPQASRPASHQQVPRLRDRVGDLDAVPGLDSAIANPAGTAALFDGERASESVGRGVCRDRRARCRRCGRSVRRCVDRKGTRHACTARRRWPKWDSSSSQASQSRGEIALPS